MKNVKEHRTAAHDIDPIYLQRWSPRSFLDKEVPESVLHSVFEAARWAPSAANMQPWHFVVARNDKDRNKFLTFINENNVAWCKRAPVLLAITSKMDSERSGDNVTHAFDTGAAWGYLALEATRKGLVTHGMGGFDREKAREVLQIPDNYAIQAVVAIGYMGGKELLDEKFHDREKPSNRKEVGEFISEGLFDKE
ncbi:nitroreductase family protein [Virgibacillus phasianinus]|uniref:Nitroreductase family protein n=1 Tax=Virgibacillus phasianinus TaxID=2017483 RepID=A0A220U4Y7_9BACI|nr:nitroreductase family protein [Virgibacillus phasianinus]ASK62793.1 nitroreductase family protein [Virgibacillus phasianinus]